MSPVRMMILAVALLAGIACVGLLAHSMSAAKAHQPVVAAAPIVIEKPMDQVLVAARDLAVGDRLAAADFRWQPFPHEAVLATYISNGAIAPTPKDEAGKVLNTGAKAAGAVQQMMTGPTADGPSARMVGAIVREAIMAGEPIVERKVVKADAAGVMAVTLDPGMRAMSVPLTAESAAGGFILPGDHVDIVQSRQVDPSATGGQRRFTTATVLENVKVLAIDQNTKPQKSTTALGATATVEVTPQQSEYLAAAKAQGDLVLTLRSYADAGGPSRAGPGANTAATPGPTVVRVYRNGIATEVKVAR